MHKEKTCCFTGHRQINKSDIPKIKAVLENKLIQLIELGYIYFESGGALGFDTIAAQSVLNLRKKYPEIKLILVLPCKSQSHSWSNDDKNIYEDIKRQSNEIIYTSDEYFRGCMHKRNRYLVDGSNICISYLITPSGGTAYTVEYAKKIGNYIINIADEI